MSTLKGWVWEAPSTVRRAWYWPGGTVMPSASRTFHTMRLKPWSVVTGAAAARAEEAAPEAPAGRRGLPVGAAVRAPPCSRLASRMSTLTAPDGVPGR